MTEPVSVRGHIYGSLLETIGATPLVSLSRLAADEGCLAEIAGKCEFFNPLSSVKDRIGLAMIEQAEAAGEIGPGTVIVEPTSGNTGIALAFVCATKGYRLILTMPESMSAERGRMVRLFGAEIELTPSGKGMQGAIARAEELLAELPDAYMPQQFRNPSNPDIHAHTTAEELWQDSAGAIDVLVIDEIGKEISGAGLDPNITGRNARGIAGFEHPRVKKIVLLDLTDATKGNASGIGCADVITQHLLSRIDFNYTYANVVTSTYLDGAYIPIAMKTNSEAVALAVKTLTGVAPQDARIVRIKNTLKLDEIAVSEPLLDEVRTHERMELMSEPVTMDLDAAA